MTLWPISGIRAKSKYFYAIEEEPLSNFSPIYLIRLHISHEGQERTLCDIQKL